MAGATDLAEGRPVSPTARGSAVRYRVLAFAVALGAITYLDRVCVAKMAPDIRRDLGLSEVQMGYVFSAFTLAYALFEIPTGAWGDRIGARRVLTRIVVWWSSFTIATAAAFNYASMLLIRFLFGAGEAGAFPNMSKAFSRWFPTTERGTAQGIFFMGVHGGGGLTPILVTALMGVMTWRWAFVVFGMVGFAWALAWSRWFRDEPADHPEVSPEERDLIVRGRGPQVEHHLDAAIFGRILADRSLVALCLMYFTQGYGFYFNMTWFPTYLEKARGFGGWWLGILAGLPLLLSAVADVTGGLVTDRVTRRFGLRAGRCGVGAASLIVAGTSMIAGVAVGNAWAAALLLSLSGAAASFLLAACWGACLDIAGPHAGLVTACMNSTGQLAGAISPVVLGYFLQHGHGDWATPLYLSGGLYLLGATCWMLVDPRRPIALGARASAP